MEISSNNSGNTAESILGKIPRPPFNVLTPKGRLIAEVGVKQITIIDSRYRHKGVIIPEFLHDKFPGKTIIYPEDPLYFRAFVLARCWDFLREGYRLKPILHGEKIAANEDLAFIIEALNNNLNR